jgi:hypothetical protein
MKKLLGSTLALALIVPASANAELLKNFKMGGSLEVDAVSANNVTDFSTAKYDNISNVQTRLMVKADWDLLDDVHAHVSIDKNDRSWGGTTGGSTAGGSSQNLNTVQSNLWVDESYVKIDKLFGALDTTIGRQYYGESGDLVIYFGPKYNLYGMPITALDAGRFDWNGEKVGVTVLGGKVTGMTGGIAAASDNASVNLYGADVHAKPMDNVSGAAYIYERTIVNSNSGAGVVNVTANDYLYVAGLKGKLTAGPAWVKAEIAKDFGSNRTVNPGTGNNVIAANYTGWAGKADAGVKVDLSNLGAVTGWGEFGIGSGGASTNRNFQAIAGDYRPGSIWGRFGAGASGAGFAGGTVNTTNTLSNLVVAGAGAKFTPAALSKLTAGISVWNFRRQTANGVATINAGNKNLGNEYDLDLTWAHSENVSVSAGVGDFQPNRGITIAAGTLNAGHVSPARLGYADLSIKF